jgi:hypothetical protein
MTTQTKSLYDRLGGLDAINALTLIIHAGRWLPRSVA